MIDVAPFSHRLVRPFVTAKGTTTHRDGWIVQCTLDGWIGRGEAAPLPGFCDDEPQQIRRDIERLRAIADRPPELPELDSWVRAHASTAVVRHALGSAVVDALAQAKHKPIARLLNPRARPDVPLNHLYVDDATLLHATMLGCQTVKLKVGVRPLADDVERVRRVRGIIGPGVDIRLDANGAWSEPEAEAAIDAFAPWGVRTIEDPVHPRQFASMARLRGRGVDIAADEAVTSVAVLKGLLAANAVDAIVIKPMRIGTPMAALRIIELADQYRLGTIVTTTIDGAIGRMMALHIAAAAPTTRLRACGLNTAGWLAEDHGATPDMTGSHVDAPTQPGLGLP